MLPTLPELEKLIGELGIDEDTHVVVVPAGVHYTDFGAAARTYWTLKVTGVTKVSILDGGTAAWQAAGNATEAGPSKPSPKIFTATLNKSLFVDAREVEAIETGRRRDAGRRAARNVLCRQGESACRAGLWAHPRRVERRQCDLLRWQSQPPEAARPSLPRWRVR
jgi:hypothetical protein